MKKIKSVKKNGRKYEYHFGKNAWQLFSYAYAIETIPDDVVRNCSLFEIEYEPERWRASKNAMYFYITGYGEIEQTYESENNVDSKYSDLGNYFQTKEEAETVLEKFKQVLENFHKSKLDSKQ